MLKRIELLVIEDDKTICESYENAVRGCENIYLIGTTNNSRTALRLTAEYSPAAVVLDLELHNGSGNGIEYLTALPSLKLERKPFIAVVTNNISAVTHDIVRRLGADFLITKSQQDYSEQMVLNLLISIFSASSPQRTADSNRNAFSGEREKSIKDRISRELDLIGISPKLKGRQYLFEAIELTTSKKFTKLSCVIAKKHEKTAASIERAMETAIQRAWRTTDIEALEKYYTAYINPAKGTPTVSEFICYYASKVIKD